MHNERTYKQSINNYIIMHEGNRTEISILGEFGLIKHLTDNIKLVNNETKYGIGDDAAVLE